MRTLSFSHDGKMLASASEDHFIDIAEVETGTCAFGEQQGGDGLEKCWGSWKGTGSTGMLRKSVAVQSTMRGSLCLM